MNQVLTMFNNLGSETFSQMACQMAPYFSTISPVMTELRPGRAVVRAPFRQEITNHLGSVHAIALCNAAELAAGMMTNVSIPKGARWIPVGMQVKYLAKAKSDITAIADGSAIDWQAAGDLDVPVEVRDAEGLLVFTARIIMSVRHA